MSLAAGSKLGPYEILALIGAGGMGEVYRAEDLRLDRIVAIKVSKEHFSERFEREGRAVAALNHPNICHLVRCSTELLGDEISPRAKLQRTDQILPRLLLGKRFGRGIV